MRPVLTALFDAIPDADVKSALREDRARSVLRDTLNREALAAGTLGRIPVDQYGDNLLHGLLALRVKFDRATAIEKLDVNLAMRTKRIP